VTSPVRRTERGQAEHVGRDLGERTQFGVVGGVFEAA